MACRKGLQAGRYGEHVKAKWLKKLSGVKDVKLTDAFAAVVVAIAKMLFKHASSCLGRGDGYGMEASYILLGYVQDEYQRWYEENQGSGEVPMPFYGDTISGRVRRFRTYTDGFAEQEVCGEHGGEYDLHPFPGGVNFGDYPLRVVECPREMRGEHVVPPPEYHKTFARIFEYRTFITDVKDIVRESDHGQVEKLEEEVRLHGDGSILLGVSYELDMERYVGEGRWCYLPRLAVSQAGFPFMQGEAFVEYAAYWYAELLDGVTSCERQLNEGYNSEEWSDPEEVPTSPAYSKQHRENEEWWNENGYYDNM